MRRLEHLSHIAGVAEGVVVAEGGLGGEGEAGQVVERDVEAARSVINFSEWNLPYDLAVYSGSSVRTGNMPPLKYVAAHPEADLSKAELEELARGLDATLKPED